MVEKIKNNKKREKGITLVALVVTIVVLLILAFISISMLMGENGIINKASESKEETIKAKEREIIKLAYQDLDMEYTLEGTDITADRVWEKLVEYDGSIKVEMKTKENLGETEIVVEKNSGEEYAEITYTETGHKYAGSLVIDENKARYEITYNANRGYGGPTKQIKIEGVPLTITGEIPERKGYSFKGWSKDSTAVVAEYVSGSQYTEDANVTLYAVWQLREDIDPVAQIGDTKYPSIQEAIYDCSQEAGDQTTTIILLKNTEEEFRTFEGQNIILDLQGNTVTSESTGTLCTNNGKIQIENGELRSNNGIGVVNYGEITIGNNSNGIDDDTPVLYGKNVGIENNGIFNFYDGKIQGIIPIQGETTSTPKEYGPVQTGYENGITTVQLRILTQYEARIGWVYYETLQGAVDIAKEKETVTLIKDLQLKETLEVSEDKNVTLDLYGYSLTVVSGVNTVINNYGDLEITDTSQGQTGNVTINSTNSNTGIRNKGEKTLKITKGTVNSNEYGIYNENTGVIEIVGGTINSNGKYAIYNAKNGNVNITGGTINKISNLYESYSIYNVNGIVEMTGGEINSTGGRNNYAIYNKANGTIKITGGIINAIQGTSYSDESCSIYNYGSGKVEIYEGTINSNKTGIYNRNVGIIEIIGGTIYNIYNYNAGTIVVKGGIVKNSITNKGTGTIEIAGGIINRVINEEAGKIKMTGGIIESKSNGISNNSDGSVEIIGGTINGDSYGIYNSSTGIIVIGNKDVEVSQEQPIVRGKHTEESSTGVEYGIYNKDGSIEFYNGLIQGNVKALGGMVTKIREGYKIENNTIDEMDSIYLIKEENKEFIAEIDGKQFTSLQDSIDSISENEEKTIKILKSFELKEPIQFNKNIVLDLNGFTITNNYYKIENNANLKITDTTQNKEGRIENINTIIGILNSGSGNIVIEEGIISSNSNYIPYPSYGIYNKSSGKIEVVGGTISSSSNRDDSGNPSFGIYNENVGIIEVNGGKIISRSAGNIENFSSNGYRSYGIYNNNSGTVKLIQGTIESTSNGNGNVDVSSYGIYDSFGSGTIEILSGIINSNSINESNSVSRDTESYGVYNSGEGNIVVQGGRISSNSHNINRNGRGKEYSYGIYNMRGNTVIGIKGDGKVLQEEPYIKGEYGGTKSTYVGYGIYNTDGTLYYYDGKIEGTTKAVYDIITEIEENTYLNYNEDETVLTLSTEKLPVAQIGEITYTDLQEAINSVKNNQEIIKILRNLNYTAQDVEIIIPNDKNIILDLNGYKIISVIPNQTIINEGILEIVDTSVEKTGIITTSVETIIKNIAGANLIISGGTIENRTGQCIYNEGELIIKEGTLSSEKYGIYNNSKGNIEVIGGTITDGTYGIYNLSDELVEISGGEVRGIGYGIYNGSNGTVKVVNGTVRGSSSSNSTTYGIYNESNGVVEIAGGTVRSSSYNDGNSYGIYNESSGIIKVTGGTVNSDKYGIYNKSTGIIKITDGTVSSYSTGGGNSGSYYSYGIYNLNNGIVEITGGTISSRTGSDKYARNSYAIYNVNNGSITIGTKGDGQVSQEVPYIKGEYKGTLSSYIGYGIYNKEGNIYYYDGKIEGTTKVISGNITEIEDNTEVLITKGETEIIQLEIKETNAVSMNDIEYNSIQKAIDNSVDTESTIKLLRNIVSGVVIDIKEEQNITIDLNGYTINNYVELQNEGTLKIIDTSSKQSGKIIGISGIAILNSGTMTLESGGIVDSGYGIQNRGILNITGGNISNNTYGVYNDGDGVTIITGGDINTNTYGAYNYSGTSNIESSGITNNDYGIYNAGGTTNIKEGAGVQSNIGIYIASGRLNIGEQGTMNQDSPIIIGETYGLSITSTGTVYMYDGQVKGKEGAVEGYITYTEQGYMVANREEGEYKVNYLALGGTANAVAQVNGVSYSNLQSAINSITGGEEQTIILLNGIIAEEIYEISEGQNIILDMNGKTITTDLEIAIKNSGNLKIVDTSNKNVASITSTTGVAIENSGTLTLGEDDGTVNQELITIEGETYGIINTGTLNFYDGTIIGATAVQGNITNKPSGYEVKTTTEDGKEKYYLSK